MPNKLLNKQFLSSELSSIAPEEAFFHILPVPFESTVSYGAGTAEAPFAILEASDQLEIYDGKSIPAELGIYTHPAVECCSNGYMAAHTTLLNIESSVQQIIDLQKLPVMIGGEHTITLGALRVLTKVYGQIGIIQLDAHADLRDHYGNAAHDPQYSHACVMRRALELGNKLFQIGVRSISPKEVDFRQSCGLQYIDAIDFAGSIFPFKQLADDFPEHIYITFDIDALDPSIMPATGTPEPGGLGWYQALHIIESILCGGTKKRQLIGLDLVEFAPIPSFHAYDYTAARLLYNIFGIIQRSLITS